jgi:hypothetical protein
MLTLLALLAIENADDVFHHSSAHLAKSAQGVVALRISDVYFLYHVVVADLANHLRTPALSLLALHTLYKSNTSHHV